MKRRLRKIKRYWQRMRHWATADRRGIKTFVGADRPLVRRYTQVDPPSEPIAHSEIEKTLIRGCDVLERIGAKYWLASGTLLGLNREGAFLKNDNEVDVDIYSDKDIYTIIKQVPFEKIVRIVANDSRYMQFAFLDQDTGVIFDIWCYHRHGPKLMNRNDYGVFWYPSEKFANLTTLLYNGRRYPCPDPDWYCGFVYGDSWKTPKSYGGHWTESYITDCRGFFYTGNRRARMFNYIQLT